VQSSEQPSAARPLSPRQASKKASKKARKASRKASLAEDALIEDALIDGAISVADQAEVDRRMSQFGPDLLNEQVTLGMFYERLSLKKNLEKTIAEVLMDQRVLAGIGNYLKAEVLYHSRVSPWRKVKDLADEEVVDLHDNAVRLINLSYNMGGATIQNYRQPDDSGGLYSRRFAVYGQEADPHGNAVIREKTPEGRTTHWVPELQR
jgi:formamidopyrimidine-DNA glycosylase